MSLFLFVLAGLTSVVMCVAMTSLYYCVNCLTCSACTTVRILHCLVLHRMTTAYLCASSAVIFLPDTGMRLVVVNIVPHASCRYKSVVNSRKNYVSSIYLKINMR